MSRNKLNDLEYTLLENQEKERERMSENVFVL